MPTVQAFGWKPCCRLCFQKFVKSVEFIAPEQISAPNFLNSLICEV